MLDAEGADKGFNFLNEEIHKLALQRLEEHVGTIEPYRLLHNMLSSQPMCFNLLGMLAGDLDLAGRTFRSILPEEVLSVDRILFEYAPQPKEHFLNDSTAFDAFVEYKRLNGGRGFIGIETKMTEPFSPKIYSGQMYDLWKAVAPVSGENWGMAQGVQLNQLWRDHLLTTALRHHHNSLYSAGFFMLVRHPCDNKCIKAVRNYQKFLKPSDNSFLDWPLDKLTNAMMPLLYGKSQEKWLSDFNTRYLSLPLSEDLWIQSGNKALRCPPLGANLPE
jgi:hypothetical protein